MKNHNDCSSLKSNKSRVTFSDVEVEIESFELDSLEINRNFDNNDHRYVDGDDDDVSVEKAQKDRIILKNCEYLKNGSNFQTTSLNSDSNKLDIGGSGLQHIPDIFLQSSGNIEEILAGQNKLQEIALKTLCEFKQLKILKLDENGLKAFPESLTNLKNLRVLDLQGNELSVIPEKITLLEK